MIVELGCWKGRSTAALVDHTPGTVYTIDSFEGGISTEDIVRIEVESRGKDTIRNEFRSSFVSELMENRLKLVEMDTVSGCEYLLHTVGPCFDLVFIDGEHSYEQVRADIQASRRLLKPGGLLSGHDFWMDGVFRAVTETFEDYQREVDNIWSVRV